MRRFGIGLFLVFVLGLAVLPAAYAEGLRGGKAAPASPFTYPGPAPCNTTLQAGISAASDGTTIVITPGTYLTASLSVTRAVSLIGGGANPAAVKLHPASGRMIQYNAPVTASFVISNLTIENGDTTGSSGGGGGIRVQSGAPPLFVNLVISHNIGVGGGGLRILSTVPATLINVSVISNTSLSDGGGIDASGSLTLINTVFQNNRAENGGGAVANDATVVGGSFERNVVTATLGMGGGLLVSNSLSLSGTTFLTNSAVRGGGAYFSSSVTLANAQFISNSAGSFGGGLFALRFLTLTNSVFFSNTTGGNGGAGYVVVNATLNGGRFENNFALGGSGALFIGSGLTLTDTEFVANKGSSGGAVTALGATLNGGLFERNSAFSCGGLASISDVKATNTIFLNNSASGTGGGACIGGGSLRGVRFENNRATTGDGGALRASGRFVISNSQFISNSASVQGGGMSFFGLQADIINSLFARNQSFDGAALALSTCCGGANIVHVTIADTSLNPGQAIAVLTGTVGITDTIVAHHITAIRQSGGTVFEDYNLFFGNTLNTAGTVISGTHSIGGNPAFVNAAADNYHLGLSSAAIDSGINAGILSDFEGNVRPIGAGFDIGFDERNLATFRLYLPLIER